MIPDEAVEALANILAQSERDEDVIRAGCLECDWRYYALTEARAHNWADAHSEEDGHSVKVAALGAAK